MFYNDDIVLKILHLIGYYVIVDPQSSKFSYYGIETNSVSLS